MTSIHRPNWSHLTRHSDIVALMVVEHQINVQNLLTRVNWEQGAGARP